MAEPAGNRTVGLAAFGGQDVAAAMLDHDTRRL
jgi:hypothetical protein